ncbi:MAG: discoidin domain-containing protein, partial [Phycisphaeraceae bacterium]|nr:discoidin domain-containing protein [Phycisphaeraceae bacterium]
SAKAADPSPAHGTEDVVYDDRLVWTSGPSAVTHDLYFGSTFEDVNSATVPVSAGQDANTYDSGSLAFGETYYWRVDEVNGTPDYSVIKGDVWRFTVEPYSLAIPGSILSVTASSFTNEFSSPQNTVDGSGLDADGAHSMNPDTMWYSASPDLAPWIQYEFEDVKKLDAMTVWNSNSAAEMAIGWGVKDVEIAYSVDGETWDVLAGANQLSRAPGLPTYDQPDHIAFGGVAAKFVRLNIASNWGGMLMSYSLSEVQFTMIPATARTPEPASGSVDVNPSAKASWRAGRGADHHLIYVDTDASAVAQGTASSTTTTTNELTLDTLALDLDQTYFWRVDEVNDAASPSTWEGPVWSFSTPVTQSVDDFESYGNLSPERPFQTWFDGFGYSEDEHFPVAYAGNGTGAGVGHDIWSLSSPYYDDDIMETDRTRTGSGQSMPFYYTNTGGIASQIDRHWVTPQDWSGHGIQTLVLYFYGDPDNTGQLYVTINDTKIPYDGDASNLTKARWNPWYVDLSSLSVSSVTTMSIGVDGAGASGVILLDDISLFRSAPELVTPVPPSTEGLVAHWTLDDGAGTAVADSAGSNHGTIEGIAQWITGPLGGALKFDALNTYVDCGTGGALDITDVITLSVWVNPMDAGNGQHNPYVGKGDHAYAIKHAAGNSFEFYIYENGWHTVNAPVTNGFNDNWYHLAGTYDGAQVKLYVNG